MKLFRILYISIAITAMLCSSCNKNDDETIPTSFLNSQTFPDANFRAYIAEITGIPEGEAIPAEVIASITSIDVREKDIASLKGIELFTELTELDCGYNQLTQLDVSNNKELTWLSCSANQLTQLGVSNNTKLTELSCYNNQLTQLDVSNSTKLTDLQCEDNQLTQLDVSNNKELTYLGCYINQLTQLDVSNNTELTGLSCYSNQLTQLDVSNNTKLTRLSCGRNQLTQLDVSNNTKLTTLWCYSNQLTQLDVSNNKELTDLSCSQYTHLPIQSLPDGKYGIRLSDDTDATRIEDLQFRTIFGTTTSATCNIEEYEGHKYLIISYETNRVTYNYECDSTRKMEVDIDVDH